MSRRFLAKIYHRNPLIRYLTLLFLILLSASLTIADEARLTLTLSTEAAELRVDLGGGSIADFHIGRDGLNPFEWDSWSKSPNSPDGASMEPRPMGHFLCLDRWGPATPAEAARGMPPHGEASKSWWKVDQAPHGYSDGVVAVLSAELPLAGLTVSRSIKLRESAAIFSVSEAVTNTRPIGRVYNMVQHPTIGPPFLDDTTIVDSNARRGFVQGLTNADPVGPEALWPTALKPDGTEVDIKRLADDGAPGVVSYVIDDEYGWITAINPSKGLLLGYIWRESDYPWISMWRNARDGKPFARGLEFGTTGLHKPMPVLLEKGKLLERSLFRFIDAGETQTFSYGCFQTEIPGDFEGVDRVEYNGETITIYERGESNRSIDLEAGRLFE